jgi:hypothetical protein
MESSCTGKLLRTEIGTLTGEEEAHSNAINSPGKDAIGESDVKKRSRKKKLSTYPLRIGND